MQKKFLALAVAAAISAPAFADNANITIYGKVNMDIEHVSSDNVGLTAAAPLGSKIAGSQNRVVSNASRLGFKGKEDLGDGLNAIYQYEVQVDADGTGGNGLGNGTRNSEVGLEGSFGTVFMGVWDTPFKAAHNPVELFDNTTFASTTDLLGHINGGALNMNTRLKDSVQYWTPNMGGFKVQLAYGMDDASKTTTAVPAVTGTNQSVTLLSAAFENEMVYAALAFQSHKDTNGAGTAVAGNKSSGTRLVAAYKFDKETQIGVTYEKLSVDVAALGLAPAVTMSRNAFELSGKTAFGANNIGFAYVKAGALSNGANVGGVLTPVPGATQVTLRYGYNFSKRTELYAMYSKVKNDTDTANNLSGNYGFSASSNVTNSQAGANQSGLGVGMIMNF